MACDTTLNGLEGAQIQISFMLGVAFEHVHLPEPSN